jgi:hypothetical protein
MPKLKDTDEVLIYPYGGWHYHIKGCWMARTDMPDKTSNYIPVVLGDIKSRKVRTDRGMRYQPCGCINLYENNSPINPNPWIKEKK